MSVSCDHITCIDHITCTDIMSRSQDEDHQKTFSNNFFREPPAIAPCKDVTLDFLSENEASHAGTGLLCQCKNRETKRLQGGEVRKKV